jgi:hypothetical protein
LHQGKIEKPPQIAKMKVPAQTGAKNSIGFKTPTGGVQEVKLPPTAKSGDVIEVPIVEIYVA